MVAARASSPSGGTIGPMRRLPDLARGHDRHRRARAPSETSPRSRSSSSPTDVVRRRSGGRAPAQARGVSGRGAARSAGAARGDGRGAAGRRARAGSCRARRHARLREGVAAWWPTRPRRRRSPRAGGLGGERVARRGAGTLGAGGWAPDRAARASLAGAPATRAGRRSRLGRQPFGSPRELAVGAHARAAGTARARRSTASDRGRFPRGRCARRRDRRARTACHRARHGGCLGARRARRVAGCAGRPAPCATCRPRRCPVPAPSSERTPRGSGLPPSSAPRSTLPRTRTRRPACRRPPRTDLRRGRADGGASQRGND